MDSDNNIDITKNVKVIEWLKCELLSTIATLFSLLAKGIKSSQEILVDVLANIILVTYLLAKRLGISFESIDLKIENKIKLEIVEEHKIEKWYGDLSSLLEYIKKSRR